MFEILCSKRVFMVITAQRYRLFLKYANDYGKIFEKKRKKWGKTKSGRGECSCFVKKYCQNLTLRKGTIWKRVGEGWVHFATSPGNFCCLPREIILLAQRDTTSLSSRYDLVYDGITALFKWKKGYFQPKIRCFLVEKKMEERQPTDS